ncbi:uncharacterized WD repeat-containing protein alr2800-like [Venturia canescens]|uniref:uncharacterized WD repeat-containing protein alr2800-like n=1 Tax=Venturia canescens TaxID=32260 RepID=UPI001C9D3590|nr:uncharacterized WD repeat-containing protein alr2800-like [Venturia canescens]
MHCRHRRRPATWSRVSVQIVQVPLKKGSTMMENVQPLQTLSIHTSDVNSVDFAGDCVLVTASGDKRVRVWEWQSGLGYKEVSFSPLLGHKYGVTCVKVSPQSTMLASSSIDGTTQLWNLRTGSKIHTMVQAGGEAVRVCRFSPDSTFLVTAGDNGQVCLWDLVRRTLSRSFQKHEGAIQSVCFSPDSSWLITTCTFGVLKLFSTNELSDSCLTDNHMVTAFASVDDAHDLGVVGCDFSIYQQEATGENGPFSKLYQLATCGNDHSVKLWEVSVIQDKCEGRPTTANITLVRLLERHSNAITCVRFSSNGLYIASSGLDKTTVIWESQTGRMAAVLVGHKRYVACCAFSKDGNLLATGSNDKSVIVWDLTGGLNVDSEIVRHCSRKSHWTEQRKENTLQEHEFVQQVENCAENDVALLQSLDEHAGAVNSVAIHANHMIASASSDKFVRIWSTDEKKDDNPDMGEEENNDEDDIDKKFEEKPFSPLDAHKYSVNYVEFSPCGKMLASCSLDGSTIIWDTETGVQAKASFINSGSAIRVCRWSPDGTKIATAGDDEKTTLWDVETMQEMRVFEGHADAITGIAFTPDSRYIVTACSEGAWRMFDTANPTNPANDDESNDALVVCDDAHDLGVQGCDFSPASSGPYATPGIRQSSFDENTLYYLLATCGNDSTVKLWQLSVSKGQDTCEENGDDAKDPEEEEETEEKLGSSSSNSVSGGDSSGGDARYKVKRCLMGHGGNVMGVKFSPVHGEILGSVATDRTARIWSVHSGVCLYVLENHESLVTTCAFSRDTSLFVTGALDKTVLIWRIPQQLVSQSTLIDRLRHNRKKVSDWKADDIAKWMNEIGLAQLAKSVRGSYMNGRHLLSLSEDELVSRLDIEEDEYMAETFKRQLFWLKRENRSRTEETSIDDADMPHEFLCPITHEVMREPVKCSDGFIYEKAAINEWFLCGKYTSPMTNEPLHDTTFTPAVALRNAICALIHGERPDP